MNTTHQFGVSGYIVVRLKSKQTGHVGASSTYLLCLSLDRVEPDYVRAPPDAVELASMAHHLT
jgi:hypothetical protein